MENRTLSVANYLVTVEQLSVRNAPSEETTVTQVTESSLFQWLTPYISYAPMLLFVLLFVCAFGIQVITKARQARNMIAIFFISLFAASIPAVLTYVQTGGGQETKAGPLEVPRAVSVTAEANESAKIVWHTEAATEGAVRISPAPFMISRALVYIADKGAISQDHLVLVPKLTLGRAYEFEVLSGGEWYNTDGHYVSFTFKHSGQSTKK